MSIQNIFQNKTYLLFVLLSSLFLTNTLVAEFVGVKIFSLEKLFGSEAFNFTLFGVDGLGFNLTAGAILWPIVFIMTDIINEYYGKKTVKFLSYIAVAVVLYAFFMVYGAILLPPNDWWQYESGLNMSNPVTDILNMNVAFGKVMGQGLWIIIGSMVAFLVGQIVDVFIFHKIKKITGEKMVWLRATGSTLVSQLLDSYVVILIAFWIGSDWELVRVLAIGTVNYIYKFGMAILLTPLIYLGHFLIDRFLGSDLSKQMKIEATLSD